MTEYGPCKLCGNTNLNLVVQAEYYNVPEI